jgi:hypothetical protein
MATNGVSQEKATRRKELLASIGRRLRESCLAAEPLSNRLSELVRNIEQSASESQHQTVTRLHIVDAWRLDEERPPRQHED